MEKTITIEKTVSTTISGKLSGKELCDMIRQHFDAPPKATVEVTEYSGATISWTIIETTEETT